MESTGKKTLVYGGKGGLGSVVVDHFKSKGWWVCSVDLAKNDTADENIIINPTDDWTTQEALAVKAAAATGSKFDSIINMAGGWAGGNAESPEFVKNADLMWKQSCWSSAISARLANLYLREGGCLVLPGAQPALEGTPGMIGYGMAKAAVHHLTKSLACPNSGMPKESVALALLPITLDTPMNRKFMPDADHSKWTPLQFVAELLFDWSNEANGDRHPRPASGSLVQLVTSGGETRLVCQD